MESSRHFHFIGENNGYAVFKAGAGTSGKWNIGWVCAEHERLWLRVHCYAV
jgi:hypothetical protein